MSTTQTAPSAPPSSASTSSFNVALAYLKAAIILLVVAHHACLAYHPAAWPIPANLLTQPRVWQTYPVVDSHRTTWAAVFATFNDVFFMALMFFVSGLFVLKSYSRKGVGGYLRDRLLRLGAPFLPAALALAPLAYYPTYLQTPVHEGFQDFLGQWARLGSWSAGPVWFCWVLLVFDLIAIALLRSPGFIESLKALTSRLTDRPMKFFGVLVGITATVYVPVALLAGPFNWAVLGPFGFQISRFLLYLIYFIAGIGVGALGLDCGLLAPRGELATHWRIWIRWTVLGFFAFAIALQAAVSRGPQPSIFNGISSWMWVVALVLFPVSCAASSLACLGASLRFFTSRNGVMEILSRNAYGIFILHFVFVSWFGYALLGASLPSFVKFLLVTLGAVGCSWLVTSALRRIPGVQKVL